MAATAAAVAAAATSVGLFYATFGVAASPPPQPPTDVAVPVGGGLAPLLSPSSPLARPLPSPPDVAVAALDAATALFSLPPAAKAVAAADPRSPAAARGFLPLGGESGGAAVEAKEGFAYGAATHHADGGGGGGSGAGGGGGGSGGPGSGGNGDSDGEGGEAAAGVGAPAVPGDGMLRRHPLAAANVWPPGLSAAHRGTLCDWYRIAWRVAVAVVDALDAAAAAADYSVDADDHTAASLPSAHGGEREAEAQSRQRPWGRRLLPAGTRADLTGGDELSIMRAFAYRPAGGAPSGATGSVPHTDWGAVTVVAATGAAPAALSLDGGDDGQSAGGGGGLERWVPSSDGVGSGSSGDDGGDGGGVWAPVPPHDGAVVVHCGDYLSLASRGAVVSPRHRVVLGSGPRTSLVFFAYPGVTAAVPLGAEGVPGLSVAADQRPEGEGGVADSATSAAGRGAPGGRRDETYADLLARKWREVARVA
ncbi:hypothetical protein MMPV_000844 [Pyropia vietnamensis]